MSSIYPETGGTNTTVKTRSCELLSIGDPSGVQRTPSASVTTRCHELLSTGDPSGVQRTPSAPVTTRGHELLSTGDPSGVEGTTSVTAILTGKFGRHLSRKAGPQLDGRQLIGARYLDQPRPRTWNQHGS